jgi:general secretion pathway protein C
LLPINIAVAVIIIALLALIASDIASYRLGHLFPKTTAKSSSQPQAVRGSDELASFAPILEKGLFGKATQGQLTPIVAATAQAKSAEAFAPADFTLLGTVMGSFRETFALILKNSSKEERVFRLGDMVFNIGRLASVKKEYVEIEAGGSRVKIISPTAVSGVPATPGATPPGQAPGAPAAATGAGNLVIDQRALNASLDNIGQTMTDARLLPSMKDGKVEGFRASEVKPQGIFGTIGIKNGDVLLRINDFPIDSPEKAIQTFASLKGQNRIRLDLVRDGKPTTFNYEIR